MRGISIRDTENKFMLDDYSAITNISYTSNSYTSFRYKGIEYSVRYCNNGYYYLACGDEVISKTEERMSPDIGYYFHDVGVRGLVGLLVYMGLVESYGTLADGIRSCEEDFEEFRINIDSTTLQGENLYAAFVNKLSKKMKDSIRNVEILYADSDYIRFAYDNDVYSVTLGKIDTDERKHKTCAKLISYNNAECYVNRGLKVVKNKGKEKVYGLNVLSFIPSFKLGRLNELDVKTLDKLVAIIGIIVPNKLESEANKLLDSLGDIMDELAELENNREQLFNECILGKII